jgi:hypothetical protein
VGSLSCNRASGIPPPKIKGATMHPAEIVIFALVAIGLLFWVYSIYKEQKG